MNAHAFKWNLAVSADVFMALPMCECGWVGPLCWNVRTALSVWQGHAGASPAPETPEHNVIVTAGAMGMHVARCQRCHAFSPPMEFEKAQAWAAQHRAQYTPPSADVPPWYGMTWAGDPFDADVAEREAVERLRQRDT